MKEFKVDPPNSQIVMFKVFTIARDEGHKLTGLRCYNSEDRCVLSVGWFQDAVFQQFELKPHEKITGIRCMIKPEQGAICYNA